MGHSSNLPTNGAWAVQRRWVRVPLNVRVRLRYERGRKQQQCHCRSLDISEGGMGLISPYEIERNQVVDLEFSLPETSVPFNLRAVVRSQVGFRLGCEFILPTDSLKTEIARYGRAFPAPKSA